MPADFFSGSRQTAGKFPAEIALLKKTCLLSDLAGAARELYAIQVSEMPLPQFTISIKYFSCCNESDAVLP